MIQIVSLTPKEYGEASIFLESQNKKRDAPFWQQRFKFWWDQNPALDGHNNTRGWIIKEENNVVGFIGNIPTQFQLFNKEVLAFNGTNLVIAPEYRKYSIKLFLNQVNYSPIVFMTTPSDHTIPIFSTFKIPLLPRGTNTKYYNKSIIILNFGNLLKKKSSNSFKSTGINKYSLKILEKLMILPVLGNGLIFGLNSFFNIYQSIKAYKLKCTDNWEIKQITHADSSFDELWERTKQLYPNTNIRTSDVINWYLSQTNRKIILFGGYLNNKLMGYILCKVYDSKMECIDLWIDPVQIGILDAFIQKVKEYSKKEGISLLIFPHFNRQLGEEYIRRGLITIAFDERKDYFKLNCSNNEEINENNSYFVGLQGDHDLW